MNPQSIQLSEEVKKRYIQRLEHLIHLKKQKLIEFEEKMKYMSGLSISQKKILEDKIYSLTKIIIPKETEMLIKLKNGENGFFDIKLIASIISYVDSKDGSSYESMEHMASNSQDKTMQNVFNAWQSQPNDSESEMDQQADLDYDPTLNIPLNPETIFTSDEQTAQLMRGSSFNPSDFDDMVLSSPKPGPSGQKVGQQADLDYDPTLNIPLNPETIFTSDEQTTVQLMRESSFSPSDFDDIALNSFPQPDLSGSELRLQSLTQKQSYGERTQTQATAQNPQQEAQRIKDLPQRILTNWVNKQKQQVLPFSQQNPFHSPKTMERNPTHSYNTPSATSTLDEYLKQQLNPNYSRSAPSATSALDEYLKQQLNPNYSRNAPSATRKSDEYLKLQRQNTNQINSKQKKDFQPRSIPARPTVVVQVPQQPISSELQPNRSTVQQNNDVNKSTHNPIFLKNALNRLGKRKADFDQTEQEQIGAYNQLRELAEERCRIAEENKQKNKEDIIDNNQVQQFQTPKSNSSNPLLSPHSQKMRIIQLVESANNYDLELLYDLQDEADKEKDYEIRKKLRNRAWKFKERLKNRMDLLSRFKEKNTTLDDYEKLVKIAQKEEKRLQEFVNFQQQSNQPGPSRLDTSKPVSQLEQLKASLQQLNGEEEYLKSKWEEKQQAIRNEEFLREEEQSPEEIEWKEQQQRIREKEHNEKLQQLHKAKQTLEKTLEQKRLELQQLAQLEKDKKETVALEEIKTQNQLHDFPSAGPSQIDISTSSQQDDSELWSSATDEKFDQWVETILNSSPDFDDTVRTPPQPQTNQWWANLVQKFNDSFTAIPSDPILAAEVRRKIKQEAKARQEEKTRLKKIAEDKSKLLKQKEEEVLNLKIEILKLWKEAWETKGLCQESSDKLKKLQILEKETKKERNQLREEVRGLKYYLRKATQVLVSIVDAFYWLVGGLSDPGYRNEVANSFENKRKNALNELLPALIEEERGACTSNARERVKNQFSEMTGIDLKDPKNLAEFNKTMEKIKDSRIELQGWQSFLGQVEYAKETRAVQQRQADSTPSGMAEKNARDEAVSRAEIDYLAQTLPQRLAEAEVIRLQQAQKNTMLWMKQNPHKFSQVNANHTKTGSQQQGQRSWLQNVSNSTTTNSLAEAPIHRREVPKAQEDQMTLERAMKFWSQPNPQFKSYEEMITSAYKINRAVYILSSNPERFRPNPSAAEQGVSAINRNTTKILASKAATTNSSTHTAGKPLSTSNVCGQKSNSQKTNKKVAVPE